MVLTEIEEIALNAILKQNDVEARSLGGIRSRGGGRGGGGGGEVLPIPSRLVGIYLVTR